MADTLSLYGKRLCGPTHGVFFKTIFFAWLILTKHIFTQNQQIAHALLNRYDVVKRACHTKKKKKEIYPLPPPPPFLCYPSLYTIATSSSTMLSLVSLPQVYTQPLISPSLCNCICYPPLPCMSESTTGGTGVSLSHYYDTIRFYRIAKAYPPFAITIYYFTQLGWHP